MPTNTLSTNVTREEYLAMERASNVRHEWIDGEVREMAGGSHEHGMIASNVAYLLMDALRERPFVVHPHDMKVRVPDSDFFYPDVVVVPHPPEFEDERSDIVINPLVVVEVLSPSTQSVDRGRKLDEYRRIPSLTDYLIVTRDRPAVDHWTRPTGGEWNLEITEDLATELPLVSIDCRLSLASVYRRLFDAATDE